MTKFQPITNTRAGLARTYTGAWRRIDGISFRAVVVESDDGIVHPVGSRVWFHTSNRSRDAWGRGILLRRSGGHADGEIADACNLSELTIGFGRVQLRGLTFEVETIPRLNLGDVHYGPWDFLELPQESGGQLSTVCL